MLYNQIQIYILDRFSMFKYPNTLYITVTLTMMIFVNNQCITTAVVGDCNIAYNSCQSKQSSIFNSCIITKCTDDSNPCQEYITTTLQQTQCLLQCCNTLVNYMTINQFNQCSKTNITQPNTNIITIVFMIIGSIAIILFIITTCLCYKYFTVPCNKFFDCLCNVITCRCFRAVDDNQDQGDQPPVVDQSASNFNHAQVQNKQWTEQTVPNEITQHTGIICAVCLYEHVSLQTQCLHYFHGYCILSWLSKNKSCPICRNRVRKIKLYCEGCSKKYIQLNIKMIKNDMVLLNGLKCQSCR